MALTSERIFAEINEIYSGGDVDPYPLFAERRRTTPVMTGDIMAEFGLPTKMRVTRNGERQTFTLFRYDDITAVYSDPATFSSAIWKETFGKMLGNVLLAMDGEIHKSWRRLLVSVFSPRNVRAWEENIFRPLAKQFVEEIAPAGRGNLVDMALRYPVRAVYETIGLSDEPESYEDFQSKALAILAANIDETDESKAGRMASNIERARQAADELYVMLMAIVQRKRAAGANGTDMISQLIRSEHEGERLTDDDVVIFVRSVLPPATETTARQFLNTMVSLLERPALLAKIRADRALLTPALREAERYDGPMVVQPRLCTRDTEIRGVHIPAGSAILLCLASGNRDEEAFPDPDSFRIDRDGPHTLTFGYGVHLCPGMKTSRIEIGALFEALLDGLPNLRLDPDHPAPEVHNFHMRSPSAVHVVWD
jgi:cytochrome P450